jgi:hypothetical protein
MTMWRSARHMTVSALTFFSLIGAAAAPGYAQPADPAGFELALSYGRNRDRVLVEEPFMEGLRLAGLRDLRVDSRPDTQETFGVSATGVAWNHLLFFTELLYNDLGSTRVSGRVPFVASRAAFTARVQFYEWTSGLRLQLPTGTWRVRPFIGGGAGTVWARIAGDADGGFTASETAHDPIYHGEVGVRVFITPHVGIAPEFRLVQIPEATFHRVLVNTVFRFK